MEFTTTSPIIIITIVFSSIILALGIVGLGYWMTRRSRATTTPSNITPLTIFHQPEPAHMGPGEWDTHYVEGVQRHRVEAACRIM
jgi:flagellar basal body-associated protein FliL